MLLHKTPPILFYMTKSSNASIFLDNFFTVYRLFYNKRKWFLVFEIAIVEFPSKILKMFKFTKFIFLHYNCIKYDKKQIEISFSMINKRIVNFSRLF